MILLGWGTEAQTGWYYDADFHASFRINMLLAKTEKGLGVLKDRSIKLSPRQRAIFVMVDGRRTREDILLATAPMGTTVDDITLLFSHGLVAPVLVDLPPPQEDSPLPKRSRTDQERYGDAYPIAVRLTSELGLRGFRLSMAVEGAKDLAALKLVAEKIRGAVGLQKFAALDQALSGEDDDDSDFGEFNNTESSWLDGASQL